MRRTAVLALSRAFAFAALAWLGAASLLPACTSTDMSVVALPDAGPAPDVTGPPGDVTALDGPTDVPPGSCRVNGDCTAPDFCTNARRCVDGRCVAVGGAPNCDDGIACTIDRCDATAGRCAHDPRDGLCPSGRFCDPKQGCVEPPTCEVGDTSCARLNHDTCNGTWSCNHATSRCERSAPVSCDDRDRCTTDTCVSGMNAHRCEHAPVARDCGARRCGPSPSGCFDCGSCAEGECNDQGECVTCPECQRRSNGMCVDAPPTQTCTDDGDRCTQDLCRGGACTHPPVANDCGTRACGPSPSGCVSSCGECPAGQFCGPDGQCSRCPECQRWNGAACVADASSRACTDDGNRCTQDVCGGGTCTHPPITNDCGARVCGMSPSGCFTCGAGTCARGTCVNGACVECGECQTLRNGVCVPASEGVSCMDDGDRCTQDVCGGGTCTHPPITSDCGGRTCGMSPSGCFTCGTCTSGQCVNGACVACPECQRWNGAACVALADGTMCTDDSNRCTNDVCASGTCRHVPVNATQDCAGRACGPSATGCTSSCGTCTSGPCSGGVCGACPPCQQWNGVACAPSPDGTACGDDGDRCTQDVCNLGRCLHPQTANDCGGRNCGPSPSGCHSCGSSDCNDRDSCTVDYCDGSGRCNNVSLNDCGGRQCGPSPSGCRNCGTCPSGYSCNNGSCTPPACGGLGQSCCSGATCNGGLVCAGSFTCQNDTTPTTTVYRFVSLCDSSHWHAIGSTATCYPSSSNGTVGCGCSTRTVNPGCSAATCWRREIAFTSALLQPAFGSFVRINHCFDGRANTYTTGGCAAAGDPTSLGWFATSPVGTWTTPVYLCQWTVGPGPTGTFQEQFFAVSPGECPGGPRATYYVKP